MAAGTGPVEEKSDRSGASLAHADPSSLSIWHEKPPGIAFDTALQNHLAMQKGQISVQTENIFPIIKKFLYSDHEIFLRELIANAVDATTKVRALASRGEVTGELGDITIDVILDKKKKTLTIRDRGIGMTSEEVVRYLNQVAFSSATEFLEKYQDEKIIGHFGLGFYSAFMVADKVEVVTRSWKDPQASRWICDGNPEYELGEATREERGTDVILHINKENKEFLEDSRIESLLGKYCRFLPVPIRFGTKKETEWIGEGEERTSVEKEVDNFINNTEPLWKKQPAELKDEDYLAFYRELHPFSPDPLFWIHLNIDYPFNLTGVLYFPRIRQSVEVQKNKIHLYANQVYVTDEVREIVPEFLTLLHGVIDSPDIPLNVSRSYLQSDSNVRKINSYITKKMAEKLASLFKKDRTAFEEKWPDIGVFVKYGMISEEKFHEAALKFVLLRNLDGKCFTVEEYREQVKALQTDKDKRLVLLYTAQPKEHHAYILAARNRGYDVLEFDQLIDNHFMQHLEHKLGDLQFKRVDADTVDQLIPGEDKTESVLSEAEQEKVKGFFSTLLGEDHMHSVQLKAMSPDDYPVLITRPEFMRRMQEMQSFQNMGGMSFPDSWNLVVNTNHPAIASKLAGLEDGEKARDLASYLYDLARLNQQMLKGEDLARFVQRSLSMLD
jgi:molecular chaperone HtpG